MIRFIIGVILWTLLFYVNKAMTYEVNTLDINNSGYTIEIIDECDNTFVKRFNHEDNIDKWIDKLIDEKLLDSCKNY